jgi:hypothetical protein
MDRHTAGSWELLQVAEAQGQVSIKDAMILKAHSIKGEKDNRFKEETEEKMAGRAKKAEHLLDSVQLQHSEKVEKQRSEWGVKQERYSLALEERYTTV